MLTEIKKESNNCVRLLFQVPKEEFEKMGYTVYLQTKENYPVIGMETGMVPKCIIEDQYGEYVFYNDIVNNLIDQEFEIMNKTYKTNKLHRENVQDIKLLQIGKNKDLIFELLVNYKVED